MTQTTDARRPPVDPTMPAAEFLRWYWPVAALTQFCTALGIPASGPKAALRARVAWALAHPGTPMPKAAKPKPKSRFKWGSETLHPDTVITDTVSFGPNLRGFFHDQIGPGFVCHGDFMTWVKSNTGATLADAVAAWHMLEARKDDPAFRREIASCNTYLQYLRDIRDAHPDLTLAQAKACWDDKKTKPAQDGMVVYAPADLAALG
ncbi:MAG: DUF6434 domain-containing protein [Pseudomonadota bacterium]